MQDFTTHCRINDITKERRDGNPIKSAAGLPESSRDDGYTENDIHRCYAKKIKEVKIIAFKNSEKSKLF